MIAGVIPAVATFLQSSSLFGDDPAARGVPQRAYLADATGASIVGRPEPFANALETLPRGAVASLFATHPPLEERVRRLRALAAESA